MFKLLLVISIAILAQSEIIEVDRYDYEWEMRGWRFDHVESRRFYQNEEQAAGIWLNYEQGIPHKGIWIFESHGIGGCCGGLWEPMTPFFNPDTDKLELLITYVSNVPLTINAYGLVNDQEVQIPHKSSRITIPPNNSTLFNWRTERVEFGDGTRWARFTSSLGYDRRGYIILDKIIIAVNEPIPEKYFQ